MAHNFQIEVPATIQLHIRQAEVIPYLELKRHPAPTLISPQRASNTAWNANVDSGIEVSKWSKEQEIAVYRLVLPGWRSVIFGYVSRSPCGAASSYQKDVYLADPKFSAAVFFIAGKNWNRISGHPNGTEMFIIDDVMYRRITWRSIGHKNRNSPILTRLESEDCFAYYLIKCKSSNKDPLRSVILSGLSAGVFKDPESTKELV